MADKQPARGRAPMDWNDVQRWMGARERQLQQTVDRINRNPAVKAVAGYVGSGTGRLTGAISEGQDAIKGLADLHRLGVRIVSPSDYRQGFANSAVGQLAQMDRRLLDAVRTPQALYETTQGVERSAKQKVFPPKVSPAPTASGELKRRFSETQDQGRLGLQVASIAVPAARLSASARQIPKLAGVDKYLAQGFNLDEALYLDDLYPKRGWGHHPIKRAWARDNNIPKEIIDNPILVVKPKGITRGEFLELHARVDPDFKGAALADGMQTWSADKLGIQPYGILGRTWYGTTPLMKASVGAGAATGVAVAEAVRPKKK